MIVDKNYCMNSYLMYRTIADHNKTFRSDIEPNFYVPELDRIGVHTSIELEEALRIQVENACKDGNVALALSGGIDSAILAKFMPKGSKAYTFRCIAPGQDVINEVPQAAKYAKECGLIHEVIEMYWEDFEKYSPVLMKHKGAPIHSIEVQIYKVAMKAKAEGITKLIFGEAADCLFGGLSNLLSRDYTFDEFVKRYQFVSPSEVLKNPQTIVGPVERHKKNGFVDPHEFLSNEFYIESMGSYHNAMTTAQVDLIAPYANCFLDVPIDYSRVRNGENKYLVREVFSKLYPGFVIPPKTPMPRPMNEWFKDWEGPSREEFIPHCTDSMSGDQKWLVWCLEQYLNMIDEV